MNTFDMINNALMRELERLDEINPSTKDGQAEIERARALKETCMAAVDNAKTTVQAISTMSRITKQKVAVPRMLGGSDE